jgi:hypothetical protein
VKKQWLALVFFGLFWSSLVLVFDGICGYGFVNQLRAQCFPHVTGNITQSETTIEHDSDGSTTGVDIRYHYEVDGKPFEGTRYRYAAGSSSDSKWAHDAVARYAVGSEVPVFYDPHNPAESLLSPGLDGSNFMWLVFLTPFNMVMLGLWVGAGFMIRDKFFKSANAGVKVIEDGRLVRVRLPRFSPWLTGLATTGLIGFIEMFLLAFTAGFHPKTGIAMAAFFVAYGGGIGVAVWQSWKIRSGQADLLIDQVDGYIEFPLTFGRKVRKRVSAKDIGGVSVDTVASTGSKGGTSYTYAPTIVVRDQKPSDGKLAEWSSEARAEQLADWLRPRLKTPPTDPKPVAWKASMPVPKDAGDKT